MEKFNTTVNSWLSIFDKNPYASTILTVVLALYAAMAAPRLPPKMAELLDNPIVKVLFIFLLGWTANKNPSVALIAAIALMITMHTISRYQIDKRVMDIIRGTQMEIRKHVGMKNTVMPEEMMDIQGEKMDPSCAKMGKYRNSFYPQYTNMKPDAYMARYTGNAVAGYDLNAAYHTV